MQEALDQAQKQENADEYRDTVEKLSRILEERKGKYGYADIRVPLQSDEHDSLAAESVLVAYRQEPAVLSVHHHYIAGVAMGWLCGRS